MGGANEKQQQAPPAAESHTGVIPLTIASYRRGCEPEGIETAVVRMQMEPKLLHLLSSCDVFSPKQPSDISEAIGFYGPLNDGYHMPKTHVYHEGYFHASSSASALESMNPRTGCAMPKPPAPLPLRAFLFQFKKVNEGWLKPLIQQLEVDMLTEETAFADIAAQSHYGDEVKISDQSISGWHFDAPNSLLHLALTLGGQRCLHVHHHVRRQEEEEEEEERAHHQKPANDNKEKANNDDEDKADGQSKDGEATKRTKESTKTNQDPFETKSSVFEMTPGNVYLTSPSTFNHAVSYSACGLENRVFALQCRTLVMSRAKLCQQQQSSFVDWDAKSKMVGAALLSAPIALPTYDQVAQEMAQMSGGEEMREAPAARLLMRM